MLTRPLGRFQGDSGTPPQKPDFSVRLGPPEKSESSLSRKGDSPKQTPKGHKKLREGLGPWNLLISRRLAPFLATHLAWRSSVLPRELENKEKAAGERDAPETLPAHFPPRSPELQCCRLKELRGAARKDRIWISKNKRKKSHWQPKIRPATWCFGSVWWHLLLTSEA